MSGHANETSQSAVVDNGDPELFVLPFLEPGGVWRVQVTAMAIGCGDLTSTAKVSDRVTTNADANADSRVRQAVVQADLSQPQWRFAGGVPSIAIPFGDWSAPVTVTVVNDGAGVMFNPSVQVDGLPAASVEVVFDNANGWSLLGDTFSQSGTIGANGSGSNSSSFTFRARIVRSTMYRYCR